MREWIRWVGNEVGERNRKKRRGNGEGVVFKDEERGSGGKEQVCPKGKEATDVRVKMGNRC